MNKHPLLVPLTMLVLLCSSRAEETPKSTNTSIELPSNPVVKRGDSKEEVARLLGPSKGWTDGDEETAYYERGYVLFRDGKAIRWSILNDEELRAKKRLMEGDVTSSVPSVPARVLSKEEQEILRKMEEERRKEQEERRKEEETEAEKRRVVEEQRQKAERQQANDTQGLCLLEYVITSRNIQLSEADILRADFAANLGSRRYKSAVALAWAADPIAWQQVHYWDIQKAGSVMQFNSDDPVRQSVQYALNRFDARQKERQQEQEEQYDAELRARRDRLELLLLNRVFQPVNVGGAQIEWKVDQINRDVQQIKMKQGLP